MCENREIWARIRCNTSSLCSNFLYFFQIFSTFCILRINFSEICKHNRSMPISNYCIQGVSKKCLKYKIASKLDICKITDNRQQPMANTGHQVCISVNFVLISSISFSRGEFKMLNFQVACTQKFQTKNSFFLALPANMEFCY